MKPNKFYKLIPGRVRCYCDAIPSWAYYCLIALATSALCLTFAWRAYANWSEIGKQYEKLDSDVRMVCERNASLRREIEQLQHDPSAIEAAARKMLDMRRPDEVVVLPDDSALEQGAYVEANAQGEYRPIDNDNLLVAYLVLVFYCGVAIIGGFIVVKGLIILLGYITRWRHLLPGSRPLSQKSYVCTHGLSLNPTSVALMLFCGLVMGGGFTFSAEKYFRVIKLRQQSVDLRHEREQLLDQQRRLLLSVEEESSPVTLEMRARKLGMRPVTSSQIFRPSHREASRIPNQRNVPPIVKETVSSIDNTASISSTDITVISPEILKLVLAVLALLGGFLAILFSLGSKSFESPAESGLHSIIIEQAPGSRFLQTADFFFSPRDVEETFKPIVADWRAEYFEALRQKRWVKARWISVRYTYSFMAAMGLSKAFSFIKSLTRVGG